jgi:hypothetical protein
MQPGPVLWKTVCRETPFAGAHNASKSWHSLCEEEGGLAIPPTFFQTFLNGVIS